MIIETILTFLCLYTIGMVASVKSVSDGGERQMEIELVRRCKNGDRLAFNELILKHQKRVFNVMFRFCGNYEDAKDLTQDVFVKVFKSLSSLKEDNKFKSWMLTIAANTFRNSYKYEKRRGKGRENSIDSPKQTLEGEIKTELKDSNPGSDELIHKARLNKIVQEKICLLKSDHKEVIVLRDIDELSYDEIAEILHVSIGTVKSRIFRARDELKGHLAGIIDTL